MLSVVNYTFMLSVVMLNVIILNVVMLSVVAPMQKGVVLVIIAKNIGLPCLSNVVKLFFLISDKNKL
jgi:hypothetical protein